MSCFGLFAILFCLKGRALGIVVADSEVRTDLDHISMTAILAVMVGAVCNAALDMVDSFMAVFRTAVVSVRHVLHLTLFIFADDRKIIIAPRNHIIQKRSAENGIMDTGGSSFVYRRR